MFLLAQLMIIFLIVGCGTEAVENDKSSELAFERVEFEDLSDENQEKVEEELEIIKGSLEEESESDNIKSYGHIILPSDSEHFYLVVFAGEKPTSGYQIKVESIEHKDNIVRILAKIIKPDPDSMQAMVLTYPFDVVRVEEDIRGYDLEFSYLDDNEPGGEGTPKDVKMPKEMIIEQELEGQVEETTVNLITKDNYSLYIDQERYLMQEIDGKDLLIPIMLLDNEEPDTFMQIQEFGDVLPNEKAQEIKYELKEDYQIVGEIEDIIDPIEAVKLTARTGDKWDDIVVKYFVIDNSEGGCFVIKQQLYVEALEGHSVRFDNMLRYFKIN